MSEGEERQGRSLAGVLVVAALVWAGGTWGAAWVNRDRLLEKLR